MKKSFEINYKQLGILIEKYQKSIINKKIQDNDGKGY